MSISMTSPVTGGAQTGFTAPTYPIVADWNLDGRSKQYVVSGTLGGTQVGVTTHSVNSPFTGRWRRPPVWKTAAQAFVNGVTGRFSKVPYNECDWLTRKGAQIALDQWMVNEMRTTSKIYAGTETYDAPNVRALVSFHIGGLSQQSAGFGDMMISGVFGA